MAINNDVIAGKESRGWIRERKKSSKNCCCCCCWLFGEQCNQASEIEIRAKKVGRSYPAHEANRLSTLIPISSAVSYTCFFFSHFFVPLCTPINSCVYIPLSFFNLAFSAVDVDGKSSPEFHLKQADPDFFPFASTCPTSYSCGEQQTVFDFLSIELVRHSWLSFGGHFASQTQMGREEKTSPRQGKVVRGKE